MTMTETEIAVEPTLHELIVWLADQTWSSFAQDLVRYYNSRGYLTEKQELAARSMRTKTLATQAARRVAKLAAKAESPEPPIGVHRREDGEIVKVYRTQAKNLAAKILTDTIDAYGTHWSFEYAGKRGLKGLSDETLLPFEDARKFGRLTSSCVNCLRPLSDERSVAAGYGAWCANNHGWPYPTMDEALEMIASEGLKFVIDERTGKAALVPATD